MDVKANWENREARKIFRESNRRRKEEVSTEKKGGAQLGPGFRSRKLHQQLAAAGVDEFVRGVAVEIAGRKQVSRSAQEHPRACLCAPLLKTRTIPSAEEVLLCQDRHDEEHELAIVGPPDAVQIRIRASHGDPISPLSRGNARGRINGRQSPFLIDRIIE